jgi:hypothetical protein
MAFGSPSAQMYSSAGGATPRRGNRSVAKRHPGATINSGKGRVLSMQTNAMRVPPARPVAPQGGGPTFRNPNASTGGVVRGGSQGSMPAAKSSRRGLKSFTYKGGLKSPGQFSG